MLSPAPPQRTANDVAAKVLAAATELVANIDLSSGTSGLTTGQLVQQFANASLAIDSSSTVSAAYMPDGKVHLSTAMLDMLGESRAALGFLIVDLTLISALGGDNEEVDAFADMVAMYSVMQAGYDPEGVADLFYRIRYAQIQGVPVDPTLLANFVSVGITNRLALLNVTLQQACGGQIPGFQADCVPVHNLWHPDFSGAIP